MTIEGATIDPALRDARRQRLAAQWPLLVGLLAMAIPTIVTLGQQTWSSEAGAHGPIVLATGLWLLSHNRLKALPVGEGPSGAVVVIPFLLGAALYIFGRAFDFISLETAGLYAVFLVACLRLCGFAEMRRNLFPFFYLAFVIPPPGWLIDQITAPLRTFVSFAALHVLTPFGLPIVRQGVTLMVAQYQLLVEDACAGMNSLVGLTAISLFYIYLLHRASWKHALTLIAFIIPVAILVNILRVVALILLTYNYGDAVAQGFLHVTTGMVLFIVAIAIIFVIDLGLRRFVFQRETAVAA